MLAATTFPVDLVTKPPDALIKAKELEESGNYFNDRTRNPKFESFELSVKNTFSMYG